MIRFLAIPVMVLASILPAPRSTAVAQETAVTVVKIVGDSHKLMLRSDGTVAGWGQWNLGQLGPVDGLLGGGRVVDHLVPIVLPDKAVDIAAGGTTSFALLADGTVVGWGEGAGGQLGIPPEKRPKLATSTQSSDYKGIERPVRIPSLSNVVAIATDGGAGYAVLRDGTVRAWGSGSMGDDRAPKTFGGPRRVEGPALVPVAVPGLTGVVGISVGGGSVLAVTKDGRVFSWGSNFYGALGRPPREELVILDTPGEIPGLTDVVQAVAGAGVATALKKDGTVWVWGSNWQQQFGFPAPTVQASMNQGWFLTPQQVPGVTGAVEIALGLTGRHTLVRLKDGTLRVWGNNDWGQLGTGGGTGFQPRPLPPKITAVVRIFAAGNNSFAVRNDGSLWAWGAGGPREWPLPTNVRVPKPAPPDLK